MPRERATGRDGQMGIDLGFRSPLVVPPPVADTGHEQPFPVDASAPFAGEGAADPIGLFPSQPTRGRGPTIYRRSQMPLGGDTDPAALLMSRMGPGAPPGGPGGGGPPGAPPMGPTPFTGNASGGSQGPQMTPQMFELAQLAQRLLMNQQGTQYLSEFLKKIAMMIKSATASQFMQHPRAGTKLASAQEKILSAVSDLGQASPTSGGPISSSLMDLVKPSVTPGGAPGGGGGPPGAMARGGPPGGGPPAYPLG